MEVQLLESWANLYTNVLVMGRESDAVEEAILAHKRLFPDHQRFSADQRVREILDVACASRNEMQLRIERINARQARLLHRKSQTGGHQ